MDVAHPAGTWAAAGVCNRPAQGARERDHRLGAHGGALGVPAIPLRPDHAARLEDDAAGLALERGDHRGRLPLGRPQGLAWVGIVEWTRSSSSSA